MTAIWKKLLSFILAHLQATTCNWWFAFQHVHQHQLPILLINTDCIAKSTDSLIQHAQ